jgi:S-DNA-T family DNA segregation ATPase FtsK/SpoIIIE
LAVILLVSLTLTTRFSIEGIVTWLGARRIHPFAGIRLRWAAWRLNRKDRKAVNELRRTDRQVVNRSIPRQVTLENPTDREARTRTEASADPGTASNRPPVVEPARRQVYSSQTTADRAERDRADADEKDADREYVLPDLSFLQEPPDSLEYDEQELVQRAEKLTMKCAEFGVTGRVQQIHPGPVVTTFELKPDPGVKYSRITNLEDDLCLAMKAESIRIDRVPGKSTVGIEVPNLKRRIIFLEEVLSSAHFRNAPSKLALGLGQLINGETFVADLARMPHLLIAGSTGSGKSVGLNCMVCSILYKARPDEVRFIMVDPKRLELGLYDQIPHLMTPIVTDPKKAANALNWAVREMEDRYKILAQQGVRNIAQFNEVARNSVASEEGEELASLPNIVIIVDELADLMMTAGKEVEMAVTRLAQMARAVGIHLILATQRPSVDVITGLIKANFPCRISFRVSSKIDSRTILDANGAEQLLGMGDSLYLSPETSRLVRIHGAYISEKEIARIVRFLKEQGEPEYREEILISDEEDSDTSLADLGDLEDKLYDEAARFVVETRKASTSLLQRRFRIGYGRAARLLDMMEHEGVVGPPDGSRPREILVPTDYFDELDLR